MIANVASHAEQVIDARAADRFEGTRAGAAARHPLRPYPRRRNVPYNQLFDAATGAMKPLDDINKAFATAGVKIDAPIVTSCGSGVSAGVLTLALYRLGIRTPRCMTAHGRNGARRADRRSRPGLRERSASEVTACARGCG